MGSNFSRLVKEAAYAARNGADTGPQIEPGETGFDERYYAGPQGQEKGYGEYLQREPGTTGGSPPPSMGGKGGNRNMNDQTPRQSLTQQGPNFESASNPFSRMAQQMGVEHGSQGSPPPGMGGKASTNGVVASNPLLARATARRNPTSAPNYSGVIPGLSPGTGARRNQAASGMQRRALPNMNAKTASTGGGEGNV
jgi:hypothetical protein